jgi:hypothetical protein
MPHPQAFARAIVFQPAFLVGWMIAAVAIFVFFCSVPSCESGEQTFPACADACLRSGRRMRSAGPAGACVCDDAPLPAPPATPRDAGAP